MPMFRADENMRIDRKENKEVGVDIWLKIGTAAGSFRELLDSTND
jgi:hypothetical protein